MSSLSRAFTNRRVKISLDIKESKDFMSRSSSTSKHNSNAARPKISGPVQLVHTTNMLSYNAPDIETTRRIPSSSSQNSAKSDAEYLSSPASYSASTVSTAPTSPESSICERPTTPEMFDIGPSSGSKNMSISSPISVPIRSDSKHMNISSPISPPVRSDSKHMNISSPISPPVRSDSRAMKISSPISGPMRSDSKHMKISSPISPPVRSDSRHMNISSPISAPAMSDMPPAIPRRAPSHTKKASIDAARQRSGSFTPAHFAPVSSHNPVSRSASTAAPSSPNRSIRSKSSMTFSRASTTSTSTTATSHSSFAAAKSPPMQSRPLYVAESPYESRQAEMSPFGQELAQVAEIAEEFGVKHRLEVIDEEERDLHARGLYAFAPEDYLQEIKAIRLSFFPESVIPNGGARPAAVWI
ncbi:hypothetical protein HOO65_020593 [Ceratocystis lukuohia]|uniref:Uncharacterized protein n=1 Tax=Ceratocystis lukuohia TaxID=2019550 RepID=A0ABR4MP90_9PEZI